MVRGGLVGGVGPIRIGRRRRPGRGPHGDVSRGHLPGAVGGRQRHVAGPRAEALGEDRVTAEALDAHVVEARRRPVGGETEPPAGEGAVLHPPHRLPVDGELDLVPESARLHVIGPADGDRE